jgi:glycosyltransferase involved in cell wall biosynthesis
MRYEPPPEDFLLSVIIPVFNEIGTLAEIIRLLRGVELNLEVIVVDDGSTDGSRELLEGVGPEVDLKLFHDRNRGKGAALRTGLAAATGDFVLIQDADLEYDPEDIHRLLDPVRKGKATVVYGSRFTGERRNMLFHHWVGNRFLTLMTNILYGSTLSDMETCYKLFRRDVIQGLTLRSNHFDFEPEVTAKVLKQGIRIYEVPISYAGREFHEGKKIHWTDGVVALWTLLKYRFVN